MTVITTSELWSFSYKPRRSKNEKTVDLKLTVRYEIRPAKTVPPDKHPGLYELLPITWEILEGNPGNVGPTRGQVYFAKRENQPELIHVHADIAGELAVQHYYYERNLQYIEDQQIIEQTTVSNYLYEQDVLNIDGPEKRLDEPRTFHTQVKIAGLDECRINRVTDKYPFKNPRDTYNIEFIAEGRRLQNNIYLKRDQVSLIIKEMEQGLRDFDKGRIAKRDEMHRTNNFVWLGYNKDTKSVGAAAYRIVFWRKPLHHG